MSQVMRDLREYVEALERVAEAARNCINMVLLNARYYDKLSDETKALIKALAELDEGSSKDG